MSSVAHTSSPSATSRANLDNYFITIKNCNSIADAHVSLRQGALNIKYGPNGIGKSTIARALMLNSQGGASLQDLLPFKLRKGGDQPGPSVTGADDIQSVLVFDENYVAQFVFQPDEVVKNSFEIFIETPEYQQGVAELESIFDGLKKLFVENQALDDVVDSFTELRDAFTVTKTGGLARNSKGFKALGVGGKLAAVPDSLQGFEDFLHSDDPAGWLAWQSKGKAYLQVSEHCPFCSTSNVDKAIAENVSAEYESAAVRNMNALRLVIDRLSGFFTPERLKQLRTITTSLDAVSPEQDQFLANLRGQIETILDKFIDLKSLSFSSLRDEPDVGKRLSAMKIDLEFLDSLNSEGTRGIVDDFNTSLDEISVQVNEIKERVGKQKALVAKSIRHNQGEINEYLRSAGYKYSVRIEPGGESYRMILEHQDIQGHVEAAGTHLSFGERNAFALILFMHQVRRDAPDLVILDDPVSSFDKTKKFAILHQLFHGRESLRGFTTLLLTHDIEPAIDIIRTATSGQFQAVTPSVKFLQGRGGVVTEKEIAPSDIMTFSQVCEENIRSSLDRVIRCIYLRRRLEVHGQTGAAYDVLSSLLHVREVPSSKGSQGELVPLGQEELQRAIAEVQETIADFDYEEMLQDLKDPSIVRSKFDQADVGYEKIQLFRIYLNSNSDSSIGDAAFKKFVNESYHIENEYVMQLNPREFDSVPEHVVETCASLMAHESGSSDS